MQYKVTVNNKTYSVEIDDINTRPIIASVNGQRFEVSPENGNQAEAQKEAGNSSNPIPFASSQNTNVTEIVAPLPGSVIEVFVKAGDEIETGQVILIIEAMKMKNSIRSTRAGRITNVLVNAGQAVTHKQALVSFENLEKATKN